MKNIQRKALAVIATSSLLLYTMAPVALANSALEISGNGSSSVNALNLQTTKDTTVVQNNSATISNNIVSNSTTGLNEADDNTGGDVVIGTGNAESKIDISTMVNMNKVENGMTSNNGDTEALISGNGSFSDNVVNVNDAVVNSVFQDNLANIANDVASNTQTGLNSADRNTNGDVVIVTGHADNEVKVTNKANANVADLNGGLGHGSSIFNDDESELGIIGNGSSSVNVIDLNRTNLMNLVQDNNALIANNILANSETGLNEADDNTGGDVRLDTGNAGSEVEIENMGNVNVAEIDDFTHGLEGLIAGNGSFSVSNLNALDDNLFSLFQGEASVFDLVNNVASIPESGLNLANRNTGGFTIGSSHDDVVVVTGHATSENKVRNAGNVNVFGTDLPRSLDLDLRFDLGELMGLHH